MPFVSHLMYNFSKFSQAGENASIHWMWPQCSSLPFSDSMCTQSHSKNYKLATKTFIKQ